MIKLHCRCGETVHNGLPDSFYINFPKPGKEECTTVNDVGTQITLMKCNTLFAFSGTKSN